MKYIPRALRYLRPYWKLAAFCVLLIMLSALISLLIPWPLKILIDSALENHPLPKFLSRILGSAVATRYGVLVFAVLAGLAVTFLERGVNVLNDYCQTKLNLSMVLDFRSDLFQHAQRLSLAYHDQKRSGMLIYAINSMADAAPRLIMTIPPLAQSAFTLLGMLWISFTIDRKLALLSLTVIPFLYYSVNYYAKNIQKRLFEVKGMEGETLGIIHEAMSMLRVIVAFGREEHEYERFREQGQRAVAARVKLTVRQTLFSLAVNMTTAAGTALVLGFGAYHVMQGKLTVGQLLIVMAYIAAVYRPLETISSTVGSLQDLLVSLRIAFDVLDTDLEIRDAPDAIEIARSQGRVTFDRVSFSYKTRVNTLKDVSFEARPGQVIAVVGQTGAGKTTLISLVPRFYDVGVGTLSIDGIDTRKLTLKSLRDQISIVLQEPLLFSATIAENIRYGRLDASMDEIVEAARASNAHDFVMGLPSQYDTVVGERGAQLSGGERQRICIARAFLKDAPILILDEPTSSIDSKTEVVILDALDRLMVGRTTFMVAHRLSTVRHADVILVLDHGELVEQGSHDELLARQGLYKQLFDMQTRQGRRRIQHALSSYAIAAGD